MARLQSTGGACHGNARDGELRTDQRTVHVALLLALCVRKMELLFAKKSAFNFERAEWTLMSEDTKTRAPIVIPLPDVVLGWLEGVMVFSGNSEYLFPATDAVAAGQTRQESFPHVSPDTLNVALRRLTSLGIAHFTVHDMRRTARTHLARMASPPTSQSVS